MIERMIAEKIMLDALKVDKSKFICWDVVVEFYWRYFNIQLPNYGCNKNNLLPPDEAYKDWKQVDDLEVGDVLVFSSTIIPGGIHTAVYLGHNEILNSSVNNKVFIDKIDDNMIEYRIMRHKSLDLGEEFKC